ncbi:MAG TPA: NAD(P)/FAD-dependent oxidoreductase [Chthoniobacterales bacterium]|nr:NAD(P)/FAD-dependent oxidoreductase [Chthoniobacterales bacterium]
MPQKIAIVGGGAAGFFAAIACAEANPANEISIYERGSEFLTKVRISGGRRCNVTHACFDPRAMSERYPRGERALISPLHRFSTTDTIAWFESHGVKLKTEEDGRMFPVTDSSQTIIDCLVGAAKAAGARLFTRKSVDAVRKSAAGFELEFSSGATAGCDRLLLATGGTRSNIGAEIARSLGHTLLPAVPSLFSFHLAEKWLRSLPGISVADVEASVPETALRERGPLLITHNGVSGPAILRLSAWGARILHEFDYAFPLRLNWAPALSEQKLLRDFRSLRESHPNRRITNSPVAELPTRLWEQLVFAAGIDRETRWTTLSRENANRLAAQILGTEVTVEGKSLNKEEFVTCGGVKLSEVDFKTMQSRIVPELYFAGEVLDIDGITGGFNFQAAWATGWIAGNAMAD